MRKTFVVLMTIIAGCTSSTTIEEEIKKMKESPFRLPLTEMTFVDVGSSSRLQTDRTEYSIVVYCDTMDCSKCYIDNLFLWNELIEWESKYDNLSFLFIIEARQFESQSLRKLLLNSGLKHSVYIDEKHLFRKSNPHLPDNLMLHVFMLNKKNDVILVGSPLHNEKMEMLYKRTLANEWQNTEARESVL
mgnify:CR=1 FL=1